MIGQRGDLIWLRPAAYHRMRPGALPLLVWQAALEARMAKWRDEAAKLAEVVWAQEDASPMQQARARRRMDALAARIEATARKRYWTVYGQRKKAIQFECALWQARAVDHGLDRNGQPVIRVNTRATFTSPEQVRRLVRGAEARLDAAGVSEAGREGAKLVLRSGWQRGRFKITKEKHAVRIALLRLVRDAACWWLDQVVATEVHSPGAFEKTSIHLSRIGMEEARAWGAKDFMTSGG